MTIIVSNATELMSALANAADGTVLELAPGDYGDVVLDGFRFLNTVTLRSQDPNAPATFDSLVIKNTSFVTLDQVAVRHVLGEGEPDWSAGLRIEKSDNISVLNSEISGSADGNHTNDGQGVLVLDSSHIRLEGNSFHDLKTGLGVGRSEYVEIRGNRFEDIRSDGIDIAGVRHVVVEENTFTDFHPSYELGDHPDMIQVWNDGSYGDMFDIAIRNNTLTRGDGGDVQSILIQGALPQADGSLPKAAYGFVIEGNMIDGGTPHGIWISNVDQAQISGNILTLAAGGSAAPVIRTDHTTNTIVDHNVAPGISDVGSTGLTYLDNTITSAIGSGTTIDGTSGGDLLNGGAGNDKIFGNAGNDTAYGHEGNDQISGGDGSDTLYGDAGNDALNGGAGNDELQGGDGDDGFFGGGGNDRIFGQDGNDALYGDGGNDLLNGGAGADEMHGGSDNDGFYGGGGDDRIYGDAGVDTIFGDGGNDRIDGGTGDDVLRGGAGSDNFVFQWAGGSDRILDFQDGADRLDFSNLSTIASMADLDVAQTSATSAVIRYYDGTAQVELALSSSAPFVLDSSDFLI